MLVLPKAIGCQPVVLMQSISHNWVQDCRDALAFLRQEVGWNSVMSNVCQNITQLDGSFSRRVEETLVRLGRKLPGGHMSWFLGSITVFHIVIDKSCHAMQCDVCFFSPNVLARFEHLIPYIQEAAQQGRGGITAPAKKASSTLTHVLLGIFDKNKPLLIVHCPIAEIMKHI